jgi:hypothetical protein
MLIALYLSDAVATVRVHGQALTGQAIAWLPNQLDPAALATPGCLRLPRSGWAGLHRADCRGESAGVCERCKHTALSLSSPGTDSTIMVFSSHIST